MFTLNSRQLRLVRKKAHLISARVICIMFVWDVQEAERKVLTFLWTSIFFLLFVLGQDLVECVRGSKKLIGSRMAQVAL